MSVPLAEDPRLPRRARIDLALVALVRIVKADGWAPDTAARELRTRVGDDGFLLRMLRVRISRVMLERPTRVGERAYVTLDRALAIDASASLEEPDRRSRGQVPPR